MSTTTKSRLLLLLAALFVVGLGVLGYVLAGGNEASGRVFLANGGGGVLFDHASHGEQAGACAVCHHDLVIGGGYSACDKCHDEGEFSADDGLEHDEILENHADEDDVTCASCHEIAPNDKAAHCGTCHGGEAAEKLSEKGCEACHDEDEVDYGDFSGHGEMLATHVEAEAELKCVQCHAVKGRSDAYHDQCNACHLKVAGDKFADDEGRALCARCHLK